MKLLALLIPLFTACTLDDRDPANPLEHLAEIPEPAPCMIVPDSEVCATACTAKGVASYIPEGTCVTFACHDDEGNLVRVGGCR